MANIQRIVRHPDGEIEVFIPARNRDGNFVLAKRDEKYRNEAANQVEVSNEAELLALARTNDYCIRMASGTSAPSLIAPGSFKISE